MKWFSPRLREVTALFLRLGFTAFGGPAAHIALMHDETVTRRKWLTDEEFLDLLGATNLIPGPNSTEMTIHLGFRRAGWLGLLAGGLGFVLPAMLITLILAWAYAEFGTTPAAGWLLYGIKPVMMAVILKAVWELARKAFKNRLGLLIGVLAAGLYFWGYNELLLMALGGVVALVFLPRPLRTAAKSPMGGGCYRGWVYRLCCKPFRLVSLCCFLRFSKLAQCCMVAAMCCWHFCALILYCDWAG